MHVDYETLVEGFHKARKRVGVISIHWYRYKYEYYYTYNLIIIIQK